MILNYKLMIHDDRLEGKNILTRDNDRIDRIDRRIDDYSFREFECEHRCSRDKFSYIDRQNLTFNHSVDAESSLEEIRSERFKDGGVLIDQFDEYIREYLTKSKNASIYKRIRPNRPIDAFNPHQRSRLNASRQTVTNISWLLDRGWTLQMQHAFMRYETRENASVGSRSNALDAFDSVKSGPL